MGLDMYLYADRFVSEYFDKDDKERAAKIQELFPEFADAEISYVRAQVGYWRKANAIHKWFVDNVQDGEDDCGSYYVSREKLQELLDIIESILSNKGKAKDALPTASGFFFGSTNIDEYYFQDLEQTKAILTKALALNPNLSLHYQSSW
jgi:hypothetical protein